MEYHIALPATIDSVTFRQWLIAKGSPWVYDPSPDTVWAIAVNRGINPSYLLAVCEHEGQCGTDGASLRNKNAGNLRPTRAGKIGRAVSISPDYFRVYAHWIDGLRDMGDLLQAYYLSLSIEEAIRLWNEGDSTHYIAKVKHLMTLWSHPNPSLA